MDALRHLSRHLIGRLHSRAHDLNRAHGHDRQTRQHLATHVARGVTTHGFAVNVENDLQPFGWVVPCGLPEVQMTSVVKEAGGDAGEGRLTAFADAVAVAFAAEHGLTPVATEPDAVWSVAGAAG